MTDAELSSLEAAASEATPGPWTHGEDAAFWLGDNENKHYVAVASPDKVLSLIGAVRQAQAERDWIISKMEFMPCYRGRCPYPPDKEREVCMKTNKLQCWKDAAEKEAICPR